MVSRDSEGSDKDVDEDNEANQDGDCQVVLVTPDIVMLPKLLLKFTKIKCFCFLYTKRSNINNFFSADVEI